MDKKLDILSEQSKTRFKYAIISTVLTLALIAFGELSDAGEVAAFSFLGVVAAGLGISKFAEYWNGD